MACILPFQAVNSAGPHWQGEPFFIHTRGVPVNTLVRDLGANYNVPVIVSELVNDVFVGELNGDAPQQVLTRLERLFNLVSWYDGQALYIYKAREVSSAVVTSQYLQPESLRSYLQHNGVLSGRGCRLRQVADFQAFEVQGVPACVKRVSQLVQEVDSKARIRATNTETLQVFPLRFASAADTSYLYREQKVVVPGVVSVLSQMRSGNTPPLGEVEGNSASASGSPQFSADASQNAVIIRARELDIPLYRKLIAQLDKPQHQIDISVAIIDVDAANLKQLGVDWGGKIG
ncbi:hypothetical protein VK95_23225, partial [Leclercia sp. LK8]